MTSLQETHRRHAAYYETVLSQADELYLAGGDAIPQALMLFHEAWPQIQAGQTWATAYAAEDEIAAQLCAAYPVSGGYCLNLRRPPYERIKWLEPALAAAQALADRRAIGSHLGSLGSAYNELGYAAKALEYYEQALQIAREIGNRRDESACLGNLGSAMLDLGKAEQAIDYHQLSPLLVKLATGVTKPPTWAILVSPTMPWDR